MSRPAARSLLPYLAAPLLLFLGAGFFWRATDKKVSPPSTSNALVRATERGDLQAVANLLAQGESPETVRTVYRPPQVTKDERHRYAPTPLLQIAARNKNRRLCEVLLSRGANVNRRGRYDYTALHLAAAAGDVQIVRLLLERGADVNARESVRGETPLHQAARGSLRGGPGRWVAPNDRADVVRLLLKKGANPKAEDKLKQTPLDFARRANNAPVLALLSSNSTVSPEGGYTKSVGR